MQAISYAQNGEDILLRRAFGDRDNGYYIDVGAAHPIGDSVTKLFYDKGWSGVNVEPAHVFAELLRAERTRDTTLEVALSNTEGSLTFYDGPERDGWSTLSPEVAADLRARGVEITERSVQTMTLTQVCQEHAPETIDFLKVDVEGHEREVLEGADWQRWRPTIIVVESTVPHSAEPSFEDWEGLLLDANYLFAIFDGINRFYVRGEDARLLERLQAPANYLDDFIPYRFAEPMRFLEEGLVARETTIEALQVRVESAETRIAELGNALLEAQRSVEYSAAEAAAARQRLAATEHAYADTRLLLRACQAALENLESGVHARASASSGTAASALSRGRSIVKKLRSGRS